MRVLGRGWRRGDHNPCFCPHRYVLALSEGFCPAPWTDGHGYAAGHSAVASGVGFGRVLAVACVAGTGTLTYVWERTPQSVQVEHGREPPVGSLVSCSRGCRKHVPARVRFQADIVRALMSHGHLFRGRSLNLTTETCIKLVWFNVFVSVYVSLFYMYPDQLDVDGAPRRALAAARAHRCACRAGRDGRRRTAARRAGLPPHAAAAVAVAGAPRIYISVSRTLRPCTPNIPALNDIDDLFG